MIARAAWSIVMLAMLGSAAACHKSQQPQNQPPSGEQITGSERIGWTQSASDPTELAEFKYAIYVDGTRSQLNDVSCSSTPTSVGFDCTGALPKMSAGAHTLELAAFTDAGAILESAKSAALHVIVSPSSTSQASLQAAAAGATPVQAIAADTFVTTTDGARLRVDVVARGLNAPTDIAAAPDGRLFIAERGGQIRIIHDGRLQAEPAVTIEEAQASSDGGLVAIAIDPHFDANHFVYAIYSSPASDGALAFSLARFRESRGTLADRAVLLGEIPAASPRSAASIRFGSDGELYVALDDGGRAAAAGDLASFNGKILRMNADATTPADQAGGTPVFSYEFHSPRGFDWQPASTLWIADAARGGTTRLTAIAASAIPKRASVVATYSLPNLEDASALSFYRGALVPAFRNDLLIASRAGRHILRIRFDPNDPSRVTTTERLLQDQVGPILAMTVTRDGTIYFSTSTELARIVPAG